MKQLLRITAGVLVLAGLASLVFYAFGGSNTGKLAWDPPVVKKSLMTFAYKVYANPAAQNGRNFLSKLVFHNNGEGSVTDFSVSYQIPDYIPWTTPESQPEIPPGQTVVKLFYPQLPSKVTQLSNQTTVTLETKIHWSDKPGVVREEVIRSNVELRGVNEIEYTDLPASEIITWYDVFATSGFAAAMVTPNDPVVKEFVAEITARTGGTMAGVTNDPKEIARMMKAVYDYMCETGMRYTSDSGVPATLGDIKTFVQTVRLPRDVIITNQGLCVELALLWSSVMEHLGVRTTVIFRPGHAFTLVWYGQGPYDFIPVECTAITPMAVGSNKFVPFNDAVNMAAEDLKKQQYQIWINIQQYQQQGFRPPELPSMDIDKIKNILAQRRRGGGRQVAQNNGGDQSQADDQANNVGGNSGPVADGFYRWTGANNLISVDIPQRWSRMENAPIPGMIFVAEDAQTSVGVNIFHYPSLRSPQDAMRQTSQSFLSAAGVRLKILSTQPKGDMVVYTGQSQTRNGVNKWVGAFRSTDAGVLGFFIGATGNNFDHNSKLIQYIISTAHIGR